MEKECYNGCIHSTEKGENSMINWFEMLVDTAAAALTVSLIPAILILVAGIVSIKLVNRILKTTLNKTKLEKAAHSLIISVVNVALYILLGLIIATKLGIDVTSIVALASVLTLALSLALQNMVSNVIGGFTILSTTPFHSGDYVEIAGQAGTVSEINMTYTKLTTPDGKLISIPNSAVVAAQIVNYSAEPVRRVEVLVSASYSMNVQDVIGALCAAGAVDKALTDPSPMAVVVSYGESAINYSLRVWCNNADYWDVFFAANQNVKKIFEERGIEMTYPHLNVHLDK
jgi:small conductance mechanosensitive channel